jgi:homocysteine S-methyltransferase
MLLLRLALNWSLKNRGCGSDPEIGDLAGSIWNISPPERQVCIATLLGQIALHRMRDAALALRAGLLFAKLDRASEGAHQFFGIGPQISRTQMDFTRFLESGAQAIAEGAVLERVRRDPALRLDPHILNGGLIYDAAGRAALAEIHSDYMRLARSAGLPLLTFTDTWRCSRRAVEASPFSGRSINEDHVRFLAELRASFGDGSPIFIGGLLGPSGDAYKPEDSLPRPAACEFHRPQVEALASAGVDFLYLATAPNVEEAAGAADAMAQTHLPYIVSFVIRRSGVVLDGTPLGAAMDRISSEAARPPAGFSVNCVHAAALEQALEAVAAADPKAAGRLLAFQGNTADCEVEELDGSEELITESPEVFASKVKHVRDHFGLRFVGGCCGTDGAHIAALARRLSCEG